MKRRWHVGSRNEKKKKMRNMRACSHLCFSKLQWSAMISVKNWVDRLTCFTCRASSSRWEGTSHQLWLVQLVQRRSTFLSTGSLLHITVTIYCSFSTQASAYPLKQRRLLENYKVTAFSSHFQLCMLWMCNETYFRLGDLWSVIFFLNWEMGWLSQGFYLSSSQRMGL